jgi:soluble lytic murein transglycosylase-like protein
MLTYLRAFLPVLYGTALQKEVHTMHKNTNVLPAGFTDVRRNNLGTRITLALAGSTIAGALLVGSLFGFHATQLSSQAQALKANSSVASSMASGVKMQRVGNATYTPGTSLNAPFNANAAQTQNVLESYTRSNTSYRNIAIRAAKHAGINPRYFVNQIRQESGFNPSAVSPAGAEGIAQFMPATAANMGVDPWNPTSALYGAARMMAGLSAEFGGNYAKALAAYNAGPGTVRYAVSVGGRNWSAYLPGETRHYISTILGR